MGEMSKHILKQEINIPLSKYVKTIIKVKETCATVFLHNNYVVWGVQDQCLAYISEMTKT